MIIANVDKIWIVHIGMRTFPDQAVFLLWSMFLVTGIVILMMEIVEQPMIF
jgi:hypothetical protein